MFSSNNFRIADPAFENIKVNTLQTLTPCAGNISVGLSYYAEAAG